MSKLKYFFLQTRPYSYASEVARAILFILFLEPNSYQYNILFSVILSILMWIFYNWISDRIQNDPGRLKVPKLLILAPLLITALSSYILADIAGLFGLFIYVLTIILYSLKTKNKYIAKLGPILRAFTIIGFFIFIVFVFEKTPTNEAWQIVILIAYLKMVRNFIGDVRDIKSDRWEFPARYGAKLSGYLAIILIFIAIFYSLFINFLQLQIILFAFIFLLLVFIIYMIWYLGIENGRMWGYAAHYMMVIWFPIFQLIITVEYKIPIEWFLIVISLLLLIPFYNSNPGKKYPSLKELKYSYNKNRL